MARDTQMTAVMTESIALGKRVSLVHCEVKSLRLQIVKKSQSCHKLPMTVNLIFCVTISRQHLML